MFFYLFDTDLTPILAIDSYISAIWERDFQKCGKFELYLQATPETIGAFQKQRLLVRQDDMTQAMIIERIEATSSATDGDRLTISGRSVQSLLSRRIIWKQTTFSGNVERVLRKMVEQAMISPEISARAIDTFSLGTAAGVDGQVRAQFTGDNLEDAVEKICKDQGIGYTVDFTGGGFAFRVYEGIDRSFAQSSRPYVIFSGDFDNLASSDVVEDETGLKNVAQVAGEGEGIGRQKVSFGSASGISRKEIFVNAAQTSSNSGELDAASYRAVLMQKGAEALAVNAAKRNLDSEIVPDGLYVFGKDYGLGDIVQVVDRWGNEYRRRVISVLENCDATGYKLIPTFSQV